jgi:hypothetical protein
MAEIKNSFLRSKMNKDLDDRLVPSGEYRNAQNISVGQSEADDIGALETILGTTIASTFGLTLDSGTTDGATTAFKLIDSTQNFVTTVSIGNRVTNSVNGSTALVTVIDSNTTLTLDTDIMSTGQDYTIDNADLEIIGQYSDKTQNRMFVFLTDYTDPLTAGNIALPPATKNCYIYQFIPNTTPGFIPLVSGTFLNFSKGTGSLITGISIIEELLFWTDNRNQPRKINIGLANPTNLPVPVYYTKESDISVAKYNPYQPISLLQKVTAVTTTAVSSATLAIADTTGIYKGMLAVQYDNADFGAEDYFYVTAVDGGLAFGTLVGGTGYVTATGLATTAVDAGGDPSSGTGLTVDITAVLGAITVVTIATPGDGYTVGDVITIVQGGGAGGSITLTSVAVFLNAAPTTVNAGDVTFLATTMTGENITFDFNGSNGGAARWPGDPDYLEDRFIRLSYRFEFDDGEYSLMAPFTPVTFIPKQKGYFLENDEDNTYQSTIVEFMENGVQNIELLIPFPDILNNVQPSSSASYKIKSLDVLYKESDATIVKVLDTIDYTEMNFEDGTTWVGTTDTNIYTYNYQSRKPFRSLPQSQITRVYDKVPVKALAQETAGNRIIYGNFKDKYTPPTLFSYYVGVGPKSLSLNFDNWCEYPNHSVKQNRNYQVGFVLCDKFGRQSDVILSGVRKQNELALDGTIYGGSTVYNPYNTLTTQGTIRDWFGDSLKIKMQESITSGTVEGTPNNTTNEPGLYANPIGSGFNIAGTTPSLNTGTGPYTSSFSAVISSTTSSDNTAGGPTTALVLVTANANIKAGMTVLGGGLPTGVTIDTVTDTQNFVLSSTQTIPLNSALTYTEYGSTNVPDEGDYMRGEYIDFIEITLRTGTGTNIDPFVITTAEKINVTSYSLTSPAIDPDLKYGYTINSIGWYSYKIVVKQQEQDYYNVYLPGILNGYPNQAQSPTLTTPTDPNPFNLPAPPFPQVGFDITSYGSGYTTPTFPTTWPGVSNVATTGSATGTGLTLQVVGSTVTPGQLSNTILLDAGGINYKVGDVLTIVGGGNDATITLTSVGETGETANIVLINDNINKVPRDLAIVGPDQKQFRSSVQMFGRVENTVVVSTPTPLPTDPKNNTQYYPGIISDTVVSISTADDADMNYNTLSIDRVGDYPAPAAPIAGGVMNLYQNNTNPLIGRISTATNIGVISTNVVETNMVPYLAIYETEPIESLLDIFWETSTVGLIADLNADILNEYTGAVGWTTYSSVLFTEVSTGDFLIDLKPLDVSGIVLPNTSVSIISIVDGYGIDQPADAITLQKFFIMVQSGGGTEGDPYKYSFSKRDAQFVFNEDQNLRNYTINLSVTNEDTNVTTTLPISVQLQNETPIIDTTTTLTDGTLPFANQIRQPTFFGVINDPGYNGVNGAADALLKLEQLQWSIEKAVGSPDDTLDYFSIEATGVNAGVITMSAAPVDLPYVLIVKLTDANAATGSIVAQHNLSITVSVTVIGNQFFASQPGNNILACAPGGGANTTCGSISYYCQETLVGGLPSAGDTILTGPNGIIDPVTNPGGSPYAIAGDYSLDCNSIQGTREYFRIAGSDGKVSSLGVQIC